MSREEAAMAYIDALLGFRRDFVSFGRAVEVLKETERIMLESAVLFRACGERGRSGSFSRGSTENEYQNHKEEFHEEVG